MKKFLKIFFIIIILILVVLAVYAIFFRKPLEMELKDYTVSVQEVTGGININVSNRPIDLVVNESSEEIKIQYSENSKEYYDIQIDNKVLKMNLISNKDLFDYIGINNSKNSSIKIEIPKNFLGNMSIMTSNNDIVIPTIEIQGNLELNINNGNITGSIKGSYDDFSIKAEAHKGKSNLLNSNEGAFKQLNVYTNNGDINLNFER